MFFDKKLKRSFETSRYLSGKCCEEDEEEEKLPFEKKDVLAVVLSALMVFGPLLLLIGGLAFLLTL